MQGVYGFVADVIVGVHLSFIAYVVVGQILILVGLALGWGWVRNQWFRWSHLVFISIVALESIANIKCPLTDWETNLRYMAGQLVDETTPVVGTSTVGLLGSPFGQGPVLAASVLHPGRFPKERSFIGGFLHDVMFFDVEYDDVRLVIAYIGFAVLVLATFLFAPPRGVPSVQALVVRLFRRGKGDAPAVPAPARTANGMPAGMPEASRKADV